MFNRECFFGFINLIVLPSAKLPAFLDFPSWSHVPMTPIVAGSWVGSHTSGGTEDGDEQKWKWMFWKKSRDFTHSKGLNPPFSFNVLLAHVPQKLGLFCLISACHVAFSLLDMFFQPQRVSRQDSKGNLVESNLGLSGTRHNGWRLVSQELHFRPPAIFWVAFLSIEDTHFGRIVGRECLPPPKMTGGELNHRIFVCLTSVSSFMWFFIECLFVTQCLLN